MTLLIRLSVIAAVTALPAFAQQLELPRPSPLARVMQTVGLTEITVEYSSPRVNGRKIFGGSVVPFGKLWRTGANAATKITFSRDAEIGGAKVPAGSYSIFTIPGEGSWTFILNKNAQASTDGYKQAEDLVRVQAKPEAIAPRERMAFLFSDTDNAGTRLDLEWERTRVSVPIKVTTDEQVAAGIAALEKNGWRTYNAAARFMLEQKKDYDAGMKLVDQSLAMREDWFNVFTKAQLLAAKGDKARAAQLGEKALQLGEKAGQGFFLADEVKKSVAEWR